MADNSANPSNPPDATPLPSPPVVAAAPRRVWGPWSSLGWTVLAGLLIVATHLLTTIGLTIVRQWVNAQANLATLATDGTLMALATLATLPVVLGLVTILVRARGWRPGDYLALAPASGRSVVLAVSGLIIWLAMSGSATIYLNRPIVPPFTLEAIFTTPLWLLSLAVVVAIPILEEVLFRGFLYRGLAESPRLGPGIAIGLTAIAWTIFHIQDNLFGLATVYMTGLYLGMVRHYSGSLILTIFLHGVANTVATAEAVRFAG